MEVEYTPEGKRITHPNGLEVFESREQIEQRKADLLAEIALLNEQILEVEEDLRRINQ